MLSKIRSAYLSGVQAFPVTVETDIARGMPAFNIVGQADSVIKEARERIRPALINSGLEYPHCRITINMSPAGVRKRGSHFDLAIAMGILISSGQLEAGVTDRCCFLGELGLDGSLTRTDGILPMVLAMKRNGVRKIYLPAANLQEASLVRDMEIHAADNLYEVLGHLTGKLTASAEKNRCFSVPEPDNGTLDFADVKGQEAAKRAIMVAVAGGHDILMTGSPSTGKTMLAERVPTIMPEMTFEEIVDTTAIYSAAGLLNPRMPCILQRPFRRPHQKITPAGLLGGGVLPVPGEITLASKGVLFLDELGEFSGNLIDALRTPLEKKQISLVRRGCSFLFPADFLLVAATNPCKCGYYGDPQKECTCADYEVKRYQKKLSGPVLDRIDMHIHLMPVEYSDLENGNAMSSEQMREQVNRARSIQEQRYRDLPISLNSQLDEHYIDVFASLGRPQRQLLAKAYETMGLTPRTLLKIRKLARTIADLSGSENIETEHLAEALQYREGRK